MPAAPTAIDLSVQLGRLRLPNPILVASGTFGYAREMTGLVDVTRLGGILPKTITAAPRTGNDVPVRIDFPYGDAPIYPGMSAQVTIYVRR